MRTSPRKWLQGTSLRTRVLSMALVPSIALLLAGVILAGYLISNAVYVRSLLTEVDEVTPEAVAFFTAVRAERGLTLTELAKPGTDNAKLEQARGRMDVAAEEFFAELPQVAENAPANVAASIARNRDNLAKLAAIRQRVDAGSIPLEDAYAYYNQLMDEFAYGLTALAKGFDDAEITYLRLESMPLFLAADGMARVHTLAAAALSSGGLTPEQYRIFTAAVGVYHERLESTKPSMIPAVSSRYEQLKNSGAWQRVLEVEKAIVGGSQDSLPVTPQQWRAAVTKVGKVLGGLYIEQSSSSTDLGIDRATETLITSIIVSVLAVLFAATVFVIALRTSNRLVRRLTSLRGQTLDIADNRLPKLVSSVRGGERVDTDSDELRIDAGSDEIGQVGEAFNKAQRTAIDAAVEEAKTREGTRTVFLNIAHRSQVIVHRQLKALDQAERKQEDPDQLDLLFQLDHLSTRARRNAENLIILGGQQPGRQWRNPVAVNDLVRGAVAETEDYARVTIGKLPEVAVQGGAVGDIVHLLAELVDNATAFSPPESRVELRGNVVGRGVVLEVEDQGLGIEQEQRDEFNAMLANPPEFSVMTLSEEPRLGLFVVARLAARHGVIVTLRESAYGGTRAIVLIRTEQIHSDPLDSEPADAVEQQAPVAPKPARELATAGAGSTASTGGDPEPPQAPENAAPSNGKPPLPSRRAPSRAAPASPPVDATVPDMPASRNGSPRNGARDVGPEGRHRWPEAHQTRRHENGAKPTSHTSAAGGGNGVSRETAPGAQPAQPPPPATRQASSQQDPGQQGLSPGRPALPQRRRQQHIAPQLRDQESPGEESAAEPVQHDDDVSADTAKHRLSAFQRGTRQARKQEEN